MNAAENLRFSYSLTQIKIFLVKNAVQTILNEYYQALHRMVHPADPAADSGEVKSKSTAGRPIKYLENLWAVRNSRLFICGILYLNSQFRLHAPPDNSLGFNRFGVCVSHSRIYR
jgi:hypothetical protein